MTLRVDLGKDHTRKLNEIKNRLGLEHYSETIRAIINIIHAEPERYQIPVTKNNEAQEVPVA